MSRRHSRVACLAVLVVCAVAALPAHAQTRVLVDASKDGGLWWFPQAGPFDPGLPHQGKALADYLRGRGMVVDETPRPEVLTCERLSRYHVVVVSAACDLHSQEELRAYAGFLARGGRLILLGDHSCTQCVLANSLGIHFAGAVWGTVRPFAPHPITAGVTELPFLAGGTVTEAPAASTTLGWVDGAPVMGIVPVGAGQVFYFGETNGIQQVPQPFVDNLFGYMLEGATPVDACLPATVPDPPQDLLVESVDGELATVRFTPPVTGPAVTGFVLRGGLAPNQVQGSLPTGSIAPVFTFPAPPGSFFIRMHSQANTEESGPSNETRLHVTDGVTPSAPANMVAMVNGSEIALAWKNTYAGGRPAQLILDVTGSVTASIPLGVTERFAFPQVPNGTYTLSLRATNAAGSSPPSNARTLTFPGPCSGVPDAPARVVAYQQNGIVFIRWDPPPAGSAPTAYLVHVIGVSTGSIRTIERTLSGSARPGTYGLSVQAVNACGAGALSSGHVVTVP